MRAEPRAIQYIKLKNMTTGKLFDKYIQLNAREGNNLQDSTCLPSVWCDSGIVVSAKGWNSGYNQKVYRAYVRVEIDVMVRYEPGLP
jgi:hypothetical protein